jgi:hypothetical protein
MQDPTADTNKQAYTGQAISYMHVPLNSALKMDIFWLLHNCNHNYGPDSRVAPNLKPFNGFNDWPCYITVILSTEHNIILG